MSDKKSTMCQQKVQDDSHFLSKVNTDNKTAEITMEMSAATTFKDSQPSSIKCHEYVVS
jgi:hypothetical protein